ncbi:hypothetical protein J1792_00655 [Streptomyces triculaminicus]|uniref:Small hydrophobic membrane protein n=2 Tax=Streptomyces TaxID=1883 RepID=A0A939FIS5_9ACTN|nr:MULTISPECIES: hypothetical protein [Streptomyces]MBO0651363.1 hypothetical protein [Streptomyces triculaminicus]QSY49676.1 hypothetical protein J3S04_00650 [Streptomyces griseocarneus]
MAFLVAALLALGLLSGTVAHIPPAVSLVAAALVSAWLLVFALRERRPHRRDH